ncbi:MAG: lysophospholipase [Candidatus Obscuribacterales bacterium]|nr:lysophospholipase [Candidatus Obscuribacterales bacterium]
MSTSSLSLLLTGILPLGFFTPSLALDSSSTFNCQDQLDRPMYSSYVAAKTNAAPILIAARSRSKGKKKAKPVAAVKTSTNVPHWSKGIKIPFRNWIPKEKPTHVVVCVHGLGFSSQSYEQFGRQMAGNRIAVYALDVRGFGEWRKNRGNAEVDFDAAVFDIEAALKAVRAAYPSTPIILVGESMGGGLVLAAASRFPGIADGVISSAPSADRYAELTSDLYVGTHFVEDKDKAIDITPIVVDRMTSDEALQDQFKANPLNKMKLTPEELKQFEEFMKENDDRVALIERTPVLMLAGFKDRLVKPAGTTDLFDETSCPEKILLVVGDGEHFLLEENQLTPQLKWLLLSWIRNPRSGR